MKRKPSVDSPSVARKRESVLKATLFTPHVCSDTIESGTSVLASCVVKNSRTRGLYPVSPTARNLPLVLRATLVTVFILSLAVHVLAFSSSGKALPGVTLSWSRLEVINGARFRVGVDVGVL